MGSATRRRLLRCALLVLVFGAMALVNAVGTYDILQWSARRKITFWQALWPELMRAGLFLLATPLALAFYRRRPLARDRRPSTLLAYAGVLAAGSLAILPLDYTLFNAGLGTFPLPWSVVVEEIVQSYLIMVPFYLLTLGGIFGALTLVDLFRLLHERALAAARLRSELATARLTALRTQLNPHFLCNTLNGILPLISHDPEAATRALVELKELFRLSLEEDGTKTTLARELEFLRRYLAIYERRFGARLTVRLGCDPGIEGALVPQLLLQPLVENAVRHGVAVRTGPGRVEVRAARRGDRLVLTVSDDGPGLVSASAERPGGVGLANTRARLASEYGAAQRFELATPPSGGLVATVEIPFTTSALQMAEAS